MVRRYEEVSESRVAPIPPDVLDPLYTFIDRDRTLRFLDEHGYLTPLLLEAHAQITSHVPPSCLFLGVAADPEATDADGTGTDTDQLVLSIGMQLDADEAMDRLDQLDNNWWLDALPQARGKLCINLAFR